MSEQPKPLSAEEVVRDAFTNGVPGSADKAGWVALRAAVFKVLATLDAERARADAAERALRSYTREARKCQASFTADPPVDCDWPNCGCDPHAERVMDGLRESGWRSLEEYLQQVERADAAERRANAYDRVLNEIAQAGCGCDEGIPYRCPSCRANDLDLSKEVMPHAGGSPSTTRDVAGAAHPNNAGRLQSTHWQGCEHAHHRCALSLMEDWQECAEHLARAIMDAVPEGERPFQMRGALAEFNRLASEATKGVSP